MAATHRDLEEDVRERRFREDLFYRLNVIRVDLPPLRNRREDIPALGRYFLSKLNRRNGKNLILSDKAIEYLGRYDWPGNVRELRTALEHAVVLCRSEAISVRDLPAVIRAGVEGSTKARPSAAEGKLSVKIAEKDAIVRALKEADGNRSEAAKNLGISRRTLHRKLHHYHLEGF